MLGGGHEGAVGGDLHLLEDVARHRAFHHLVADEEAAECLAETGDLAGHVLDHGGVATEPFDTAAHEVGLPAGLVEMALQPGLQLRIIFDPTRGVAQHLLRLLLHGVSVAKPVDQHLAGPGVRQCRRHARLPMAVASGDQSAGRGRRALDRTRHQRAAPP